MKPLFNLKEVETCKRGTIFNFECENCQKVFSIGAYNVRYYLKINRTIKYCCRDCADKGKSKNSRKIQNCNQCNKPIERRKSLFGKNGFAFCNQSCACSYRNAHKTYGYKRSKLEKWIEIKLLEKYPNLQFDFNKNNTINAELDIFIPSLNLAFELNGIFHYEPIYGEEKLAKQINNDKRKFQACLEKNIELCIIDTSKQHHFKEQKSLEFLNIIIDIINNKINIPIE